MKKQGYVGLAAFAFTASMLTGCKIGDLDYTLDKDPVEMHGDSVRVSITVKVPEKGMPKKVIAEITPMLGDKAFKTIIIQGEKATGNGKTINFKPGGTINYTDVIAYSPELSNADLKITGSATKGSKDIEIEDQKIADGTIITPLLIQNDDKSLLGNDEFVRTTEEIYSESQINFAKAKSNISGSELKQADVKALTEWMTSAMTNPKVAPKSINLESFASPEGEVGKNGTLADDRANATKEAMVKILAKMNYEGADAMIKTMPKGEDWAGFKAAVNASDLEDKALIIRVLEMTKDPVKREEDIKKMSKTYQRLEKDILPSLRRTQINVVYDKIGWSDEELKGLSTSNPDTLTVEELLFTASLSDDLNEKLRLYNLVVSQYSNDWRGHNNVGAIQYMQNDMASAKGNFEKANNLNENAISLNNLGLVARQEGDRAKATELFNSALSAGSEVKYNLGLIDIQNGDYEQAIGNMGSENTFNKALAQVLAGDNEAALTTLDASSDNNTAIGYYLKAVIGARQNNLDLLTNNLTSAIAKDASLKSKAVKDREFIKFLDNAAFQNLVK
jgi:tetratricopeptide (TPR) repeat protein